MWTNMEVHDNGGNYQSFASSSEPPREPGSPPKQLVDGSVPAHVKHSPDSKQAFHSEDSPRADSGSVPGVMMSQCPSKDQQQRKCKEGPSVEKQELHLPNVLGQMGRLGSPLLQKNMFVEGTMQNKQEIEDEELKLWKRRSSNLRTYPPSKKQRISLAQTSNCSNSAPQGQPVSPITQKTMSSTDQSKGAVCSAGASLADKEKVRSVVKTAHRVKNERSVTMEEPPLFVPDNLKPQPPPAKTESVWDPTKHCAFCKKPHNNRFMIGCGRCDDWFHGECVGLDITKAQQMEQEDQEFVCLKCCAEEDKKVKTDAQAQALPPAQESKAAMKMVAVCSLPQKEPGDRMPRSVDCVEKKSGRISIADRKGMPMKHEFKKVDSVKYQATSKKPSVEQIRSNVCESLKDILLKRLLESNLKLPEDRSAKVAQKIEKELFGFFRDTDTKYKSKYRSLMFNLKDVKNKVLFKRVLKGDISPGHLVRMSPEELASKELAAWRKREKQHTIEMIEKEQREIERRPITKITHKGEIEIENQEPVKEPEILEAVPESKPPEEVEEILQEKMESSSDATSDHKNHLFSLQCKICKGLIAPPVEVAPNSTLLQRKSCEDEVIASSSHTECNELVLSALEISDEGTVPSEQRLEGDLKVHLWKGFINMPSVAKFLTKAYPISGILENLTKDLPDSIQVGGRIAPQTVWDYVEKLRATATKELCLIHFSPVTEEDEISYTLLYAYFSSRKRYGVVANNTKQVKDMYLIPLGSCEKIPSQLACSDALELEADHPNLLLGLIIRQKTKKNFEVALPIGKSKFAPAKRTEARSLTYPVNSFTQASDCFGSTAKVQHSVQCNAEGLTKAEVAPSGVDPTGQEPAALLRFLPGVLSGPVSTSQGSEGGFSDADGYARQSASNRNAYVRSVSLDRFTVKKRDTKMDEVPSSSNANFSVKEMIDHNCVLTDSSYVDARKILDNLMAPLQTKSVDHSFQGSIERPVEHTDVPLPAHTQHEYSQYPQMDNFSANLYGQTDIRPPTFAGAQVYPSPEFTFNAAYPQQQVQHNFSYQPQPHPPSPGMWSAGVPQQPFGSYQHYSDPYEKQSTPLAGSYQQQQHHSRDFY